MATLWDHLIINGMRLRNRLVLPPLTTNYGSPEGKVTDAVLRFYKKRAGEVGLVIVEATAVRADGRIVPGSIGLWEDSQVLGMVSLAEAIKKQGAAAMVQLSHAGARCVPLGGEMQGASPSGFIFRPDVPSFSMNQAQIDRMVYDFAEAAFRAAEAGFDGVEIHGAHFYLISQFLSPLTNQRQDRYGGDAGARATFALEVIRAARQRVGRSYPIFFRINAVEKVEGGQTLAEAQIAGRVLAQAGVDALDVSLIAQSSWRETEGRRFLNSSSALPKDQPAGANVGLAAKLKEATGLPVMAVGKLGLGTAAAEAVADAGIDMAAVGRQMICDPDTAKKILSGKNAEIILCKECLSCFASIGKGVPLVCTVNKNIF